MKKKTATYIVLAALVCVLMFVIGMRAGLHDKNAVAEERAAETAQMYQEQVAALEHELELERQTEHVLVTYEYKPLPVDYENIGNIMPEDSDAVILAKMLWGEFNDASDYDQCAAACWNVLNRVDAGYGDLKHVCNPGQYFGYSPNHPVDADLYAIAREVLARWELEKFAVNTDVGRVLPRDYLWFEGRDGKNIFRNAYEGGDHITP